MNLQKRMRLFKFELVVGSVGVNKKCPTYDSIFFVEAAFDIRTKK